jgi:putative transposase
MRSGRPKAQLILTDEEKEQLEAIKRSRTLPAGLVRRAEIVLHSASGLSNTEISNRLGVTPFTVGTWRKRFLANRIEGLHDELRWQTPEYRRRPRSSSY